MNIWKKISKKLDESWIIVDKYQQLGWVQQFIRVGKFFIFFYFFLVNRSSRSRQIGLCRGLLHLICSHHHPKASSCPLSQICFVHLLLPFSFSVLFFPLSLCVYPFPSILHHQKKIRMAVSLLIINNFFIIILHFDWQITNKSGFILG